MNSLLMMMNSYMKVWINQILSTPSFFYDLRSYMNMDNEHWDDEEMAKNTNV